MVRLADVAERAEVSLTTASAVLNGKASTLRVSPKTAQKILAIAAELNYIPNYSARLLSGQASHTIGVLVDSQDVAVRFSQLEYIDHEAERQGYRLLIAEAHNSSDRQLINYRTLLQYGVDGVICHSNSMHEKLRQEKNVVFFGAEAIENAACVYYDIESGYREAVTALKKSGRHKIAAFFDVKPEYDSLRARYQAYRNLESCFTGGFMKPQQATPEQMNSEAHRVASEWLIPQHIDALIVQNDYWALAFLFALRQLGLKVPQDIALVGQDNLPFCWCTTPRLSTIDPNLEFLAKSVVELLLKSMRAPSKINEVVRVPTTFIDRESTLVAN